eukprot:scaffold1071_cov328-Pavlova_lutheri.AAC.6
MESDICRFNPNTKPRRSALQPITLSFSNSLRMDRIEEYLVCGPMVPHKRPLCKDGALDGQGDESGEASKKAFAIARGSRAPASMLPD